MTDPQALKQGAATRALGLVRPGMLLGLGSGSTARYFIEGVGRMVSAGIPLSAIATSRASAEQAVSLGIPLVEDPERLIDLAVDGADEVDAQRNLVKGRGGALLREKLVAAAAARFVIIVDDSKVVSQLGRGPIPVEVFPFLWRQTARRLEPLVSSWRLRGGEQQPFLTDNGNLILDLSIRGGIRDPASLANALKGTPGVLEHGLFLGVATACIVASAEGLRVLGSLD